MAVPRNAPKVPSYCHPLPANSPVGSLVLAVGSPVRNRITPYAAAAQVNIAIAISEILKPPAKRICLRTFIDDSVPIEDIEGEYHRLRHFGYARSQPCRSSVLLIVSTLSLRRRPAIVRRMKISIVRVLLVLQTLQICAFATNSVVNLSHYDLMRPDFERMKAE